MIDVKPLIRVFLICSDRNNPCGFPFSFVGCIVFEMKIGYSIFICYKLTVIPGGVSFVTKNISQIRKMFQEVFELWRVMSFRWRDGKPVNDTRVHIHADVEFDTIPFGVFPSDPYIIPDATVARTEPCAVHGDVHSFPTEEPCYLVHHPSDAFD